MNKIVYFLDENAKSVNNITTPYFLTQFCVYCHTIPYGFMLRGKLKRWLIEGYLQHKTVRFRCVITQSGYFLTSPFFSRHLFRCRLSVGLGVGYIPSETPIKPRLGVVSVGSVG